MPLTKSDFMSGHQCHRLLWWRRHEPDAPELQPDRVLQDLFDQGNLVGALARARFPDGVLIPSARSREERVRLTAETIDAGARAIFEGAFMVGDLFVATDVIVRDDRGWHLIEVKSSSRLKDEHVPDASVQAHAMRASGLDPVRIEVMHLNREFLHPDVGNLFAQSDVTGEARAMTPGLPDEIGRQLEILEGPIPPRAIGLHCDEPRPCPFKPRCWPQDERHIANLYNVGPKKAAQYMASGVHSIDDLPPDAKLPEAARRQRRSLGTGQVVVEPGLRAALAPLDVAPLGFLDFETIARAVPVWPAMAPWGQAAAQFSYHELRADGSYAHVEHLAEGPADARPLLAQRLVDATRHARLVVMYSSFERTQIRALADAVPALAAELQALDRKLFNLLKVVREHVYHPAFRGSFSLKFVLPALVPDLTYDDLVIVNGMIASVEIARLLFVADRIPATERDRVRQDLLAYCKRDTWATVRLLEVLRTMAR